MALRKSTQVLNRASALAPDRASSAVIIMAEFVVMAGLANGDIIEMAALPAGTVVVEAKLVADDIDTANTVTADVGLMSGAYLAPLNADNSPRTCGADFFSADTTMRTGGVAVSALKAGHMLAPSYEDRAIGIKLTAALTAIAGAKIRLYITAVPAPVGAVFV